MKEKTIDFLKSIRGAYGMVFFSNSTVFALCLLLSSFFDPCVGMAGLLSALFSLGLSVVLGLNPVLVRNGTYSFNSLLTGLALGTCFRFNLNFLLVLFFASSLAVAVTVFFATLSEKSRFPFLSLPFIVTIWIVLLNARSIEINFLVPRDASGCATVWGTAFSDLSFSLSEALPAWASTYFRSIAAVFFQTHLLAGILIATGLLLFSRIAFTLSLAGFFAGMLYSRYVQGNINDQEYSLAAFNYILTALGLGGYFLIASRASFLLVLLTAPLTGLLTMALYKLSAPYYLPLYSLPFSVTVMLVMALLNHRYTFRGLYPVYIQQFSPEKNLYAFHAFSERFRHHTSIMIHLPFFGEWTVSQGQNGSLTHKDDWRFALDFVVTDEQQRSFRFPGRSLTDFYCYGLPVLAPADGQVITVEDGIEDNEIGDVNLAQNWGNTIIIRHGDYLYSKISHLKKGSFKVKQGDTVKKGDLLAACGNSGRSPEPHLHFQLQASEYIGAATINFPLSSYIVKGKSGSHMRFFDVPQEGEVITRPVASPILKKAFHFIPGMKLCFEVTEQDRRYTEQWEVFTDIFNNAYLQCCRTGAHAYFKSVDALFYFTAFEGDTSCLLFYFYLGAYKIVLSQQEELSIRDSLSVEGIRKGPVKILQDFAAPFYRFIRPVYTSTLRPANGEGPPMLKICSEISTGGLAGKQVSCEILVTENGISVFTCIVNGRCIRARLDL